MRTRTLRGLGVVVVTVVLALGLATGGAAAHGGDDGVHHHDGAFGMHDGGWWGLGWVWMLGALLVLVLLPVLAVLAVLRGDGGSDTALERLRERYAAGEIDEEEFQRRRETLEN